jgi:hypothetical protein
MNVQSAKPTGGGGRAEERSKRVMEAMMDMTKIEIAGLKRAYEGS